MPSLRGGGEWRAGSWSLCFDLVGHGVGGLRDCLIIHQYSLSKNFLLSGVHHISVAFLLITFVTCNNLQLDEVCINWYIDREIGR